MISDLYFMEQALKEAKKAFVEDEVPVGAVIVFDGKIIARGHNKREATNDPTSHAEIIAIRKACRKLNSWRLVDTTLYVTIEPCIMCAGAISWARIKKVVYGAKDVKGGALGSTINIYEKTGLNHYPLVEHGILENDCASIIKEYFKSKR